MKIKYILLFVWMTCAFVSCQVSDFEENYADPSRVSETSVEKQFTGFIFTNREYVLPSYWNYFVVLRITLNRYNQAIGLENGENQYVPGSAAVNDRWNNYFNFLAQFRELEKVYNGLSPQAQADYRVFMMAGYTYFYDHTQKVVDLHGDIPWSNAGMLSTNGGDFGRSYPEYESAESIYTKMLDDLARFADEMRGMSLNPAIETGFRTQDLINRGDVDLWLRYINSLRLRMLMRVSEVPGFSARANSEIAAIISNPTNYPIVESNNHNILFRIHELGTLIGATSFQSGLEDWNGNIAGKLILDHMLENQDPRLTYVFQPGDEAEGQYLGLDPLMNPSEQTALIGTGTLSVYNRSTLSRNQYFPGVLINSAQVHFLLSEYFLKNNQEAKAKEHYETGIRESISYYEYLRALSNDNSAGAPVIPEEENIAAYISSPKVSWDLAQGPDEKIKLISEQRWLHFNVVQPNELWADMRRLRVLDLPFWEDQSNEQRLPPNRWVYPGSEQTYNPENYARVQPMDNLNTRVFWDTK